MRSRLPPRPVAAAVVAAHAALVRAAFGMLPSEVAAWRLSSSFMTTRLIAAVTAVGVPDALAGGPATAEQLARRLGLDADALHRTLRALAVQGVVRLDRRGRFRLTRIGRRLRRDDPLSFHDWMLYVDRPATQDAWHGLARTLRTGEPSFAAVHGTSVWTHFTAHPDEEQEFARAMRTLTRLVSAAVVHGYPWPAKGTVCDVGGGVGTLLADVLDAHHGLHGVLVDAPGVLREAEPFLAARGLDDRVELSPGDIFGRIDAKADLYLLKDVLHDWDDERSVRILRAVRAAMPGGARVVLVETLQERDRPDPIASLIDVHMLTQCDGGRQRSAGELHALLRAAGLTPGAVRRTPGPALVEGLADQPRTAPSAQDRPATFPRS